jgi:hypothetical protein
MSKYQIKPVLRLGGHFPGRRRKSGGRRHEAFLRSTGGGTSDICTSIMMMAIQISCAVRFKTFSKRLAEPQRIILDQRLSSHVEDCSLKPRWAGSAAEGFLPPPGFRHVSSSLLVTVPGATP